MVEHRFGGAWTEQKLDAIRRYIRAYNIALKNQPFKRVYIDAFAGTGARESAEADQSEQLSLLDDLDEVSKGSARIALECDPPFHAYAFIERDEQKAEALRQLTGEFSERISTVYCREANDALQQICDQTNWRKTRAVLFLDPYGMQVKWSTLQAIAGTKSIDMWILCPTGMGFNRMLAKNGRISEAWKACITNAFGCNDWEAAFYSRDEVTDLFGEPIERVEKTVTIAGLEAFFRRRLETIFSAVLPTSLPLQNSRGQLMYNLIFAVGNPNGVKPALKMAAHIIKTSKSKR